MTTAVVLLLRTPVGTVAVVGTSVLQRGPRNITAGAAAAATVDLRWRGKGWDVGIYAIAPEEAMAAQIPTLTTGAADSVEPPWPSRCASSPRARLVHIARTRFPKSGRRNVAPVAVAAGKTNAAVLSS